MFEREPSDAPQGATDVRERIAGLPVDQQLEVDLRRPAAPPAPSGGGAQEFALGKLLRLGADDGLASAVPSCPVGWCTAAAAAARQGLDHSQPYYRQPGELIRLHQTVIDVFVVSQVETVAEDGTSTFRVMKIDGPNLPRSVGPLCVDDLELIRDALAAVKEIVAVSGGVAVWE